VSMHPMLQRVSALCPGPVVCPATPDNFSNKTSPRPIPPFPLMGLSFSPPLTLLYYVASGTPPVRRGLDGVFPIKPSHPSPYSPVELPDELRFFLGSLKHFITGTQLHPALFHRCLRARTLPTLLGFLSAFCFFTDSLFPGPCGNSTLGAHYVAVSPRSVPSPLR